MAIRDSPLGLISVAYFWLKTSKSDIPTRSNIEMRLFD